MQWDTLVLNIDTGSTIKRWSGTIDTPVCPRLVKAADTFGGGQALLKAVTTEKFVQYEWPECEPFFHLRLCREIG